MASARVRRRTEEDELLVAPSRFDAYTGMLVVSVVATLLGIIFLYLDWKDYPGNVPNVKALATPPPAAQSAPPAGGQPKAPAQ
jgi:hypothetical protein